MDLQDELEDSRTSAVGRKRDLQEATRDDPMKDEDSEVGDSKRLKVDLTPEKENALVSAEAPVSSENNAADDTDLPSVRQKTWNAGIQAGHGLGLRTSFGSKAKKLPSAEKPLLYEETSSSPDAMQPPKTQNQSVIDGDAVPLSFKKLSKKEEKLLQREDLDAYNTYRKSLALNYRAKQAARVQKVNEPASNRAIEEPKSAGEEEDEVSGEEEEGEVSGTDGDDAEDSDGEPEGEDGALAAAPSTSPIWIVNGRFRRLKQPSLKTLTKHDRKVYLGAKSQHDAAEKQKVLISNTASVDALLRNNFSWPVSNPRLAALVSAGKTFYPSQGAEVLQSFNPPHGLLALHVKASDLTYEDFAHHFLIANRDRQISKGKLRSSFKKFVNIWYGHVPDIRWRDKALLNKASDEFDLEAAQKLVLPMTALEPVTTDSAEPKRLGALDADSEMENAAPSIASRDDHADLLQQRYFPGVDGQPKPCISCARYGHNWPNCPELECSCGVSQDHSEMLCPQRVRCTKCQQVGHSRQQCPEKLALPASDAPPCDLCNTHGHAGGDCHLLWRSYRPHPSEIRKVKAIPAFCYCCGGDHFGSDCGLNNSRSLSGGFTWSQANLQRYVDPNSQDRALSAGVDYTVGNGKGKGKGQGFSIRGRANQYVELADSDDEEAFIRPRVPPPQQPGHIRFNSSNDRPRYDYEPDHNRDYRGNGSGSYSGGYASQPSSSYNGYAPGLGPTRNTGPPPGNPGRGGKGHRGNVRQHDIHTYGRDPKRRR